MAAMQILPPPPRRAPRKSARNVDSVPAMLTPGEFVLPPDTISRLGGAPALQALVAATHTSVQNPQVDMRNAPRGFRPELFFTSGGPVSEEEKRRQSLIGQIPVDDDVKAPAARESFQSGRSLAAVAKGAGEDAREAWGRGEYGRAAGAGLRGVLAAIPASFVDAGADVAHYGAPAARAALARACLALRTMMGTP